MSEVLTTEDAQTALARNSNLPEKRPILEATKRSKSRENGSYPERGPIVGYTSPHDVILAEVYGDSTPGPTDDGYLREEDIKNMKSKGGTMTPPLQTHNSTGGTREMLYDPFDGTPLGILATDSLASDKRKGTGSSKRTSPQSPGEEWYDRGEQWPHLSQVLKLQTEISKMHLDMEGIGPGEKGKVTGKGRRGKGMNSLDTRSRQHTFWGEGAGNERHHPRDPTSDTMGDEHEGDEEGVGVAGDEENENRKKREAEFASMADHFEERKQAIHEIMGKLDDLSKALTDFHSLQPPMFEFTRSSSRQTTGVTPDATPPHTFPTSYGSSNLPNTAPPMLFGSKTISPNPLTPGDLNILPASFSRTQPPHSKAVEYLIIDSVDPGKQRHLMDSPDSIQQHVKLPEEELGG